MFGVDQVKALNDLEMLVYGYVMKYPEKVRYMRIRELASEAHVSTSTILRFCKKMGCGGYTEFKLQLKEHLEHRGQVRIKDDISEVIFNADHVFLAGSGMSGIVAKYGARYFSSMGKFCLYIDEPHYPTESRFLEHSLVIVFSVSGESRDTIGHVTRFKEQGCIILSITNTENCTIAKLSDYNIPYYVTYMRLKDYDVTTQIPAISIVERLGKKLYQYTSKGPGPI